MKKIRLVVINENTLGYIKPEQKDTCYILHASILKGATFAIHPHCRYINKSDKVRLANKKDFSNFRVSMNGFDNEKFYEFDKS